MRPVSDKLAPRLFAGTAIGAIVAVLWTAASGADDSRASVDPAPPIRTGTVEYDLEPPVRLASVPDPRPEPTDSIAEPEEPPRAPEAAPTVDPARVAAAEQRAVKALLDIARAQERARTAVAVDTDGDGAGEYAYIAELNGTAPVRGHDAGAGLAVMTDAPLDPAFLDPALGVLRSGRSGGVLEADGYAFQVFLPAAAEGGSVRGLGEASAGGAGTVLPGADEGERHYACYAWPLLADGPGRRAFFVNERGDVVACANDGDVRYVGPAGGPAFDAAYTVEGDLSSPIASSGARAVDGRGWSSIDD